MPRIKIDSEKCIGCGLCETICEKNFEMNGDKAIVKDSEVKGTSSEKEAIESCPTEAIYISK